MKEIDSNFFFKVTCTLHYEHCHDNTLERVSLHVITVVFLPLL